MVAVRQVLSVRRLEGFSILAFSFREVRGLLLFVLVVVAVLGIRRALVVIQQSGTDPLVPVMVPLRFWIPIVR